MARLVARRAIPNLVEVQIEDGPANGLKPASISGLGTSASDPERTLAVHRDIDHLPTKPSEDSRPLSRR